MSSRLNFGKSLDFVGTVGAGNTLKALLDGGPTIDEIDFHTDLTAAEIEYAQVKIDGDLRVEMTGQQMLDREAYDGRAATSNHFIIAMSDSLAGTLQGEMMSGLCTKPGQRVEVIVKIASGATLGGSEFLDMYVETSPYRPEEFRLYILPELVPVSNTGENRFDNFRQGARRGQNFIRRIFNYGNITHLEIQQDRRTVFGEGPLPAAVNNARLDRNGKTEPSSCFVVDFLLKGRNTNDMFDTFSVESLRATYTTGNSNDITALTEYLQDVRPVANV